MGRGTVAARKLIGRLLYLTLPVHPAQGAFFRENSGIHGHKQCRIGVLPVPVRIAHAVGHRAALFRGCRHHKAAGAHAEGIYRAVFQVLHQLIVRRGQMGILPAVLGLVDFFLPLLDAHTHGKGLGLHGYSPGKQSLEGIPGAVANGKDGPVAGDLLPACQLHAGQPAFLQQEIRHPALEVHLAAQGDDLFAEILHHLQQHIRAHMGFGIIEDILPGSKSHKLFQNPVNSGIADAGVQLAV